MSIAGDGQKYPHVAYGSCVTHHACACMMAKADQADRYQAALDGLLSDEAIMAGLDVLSGKALFLKPEELRDAVAACIAWNQDAPTERNDA